jgi:hypothetical protein
MLLPTRRFALGHARDQQGEPAAPYIKAQYTQAGGGIPDLNCPLVVCPPAPELVRPESAADRERAHTHTRARP